MTWANCIILHACTEGNRQLDWSNCITLIDNEGNRQTDRQTDRQTRLTALPLLLNTGGNRAMVEPFNL